ncbi:MAG: hypothetical protein ACOVN9_01790 [Inhella sp.]
MNDALLREIEGRIGDYLRGMARADGRALDEVAGFGHWPEMAERERAARAARLVRVLSDVELEAVAEGHVCLQALATRVQAELRAKELQS